MLVATRRAIKFRETWNKDDIYGEGGAESTERLMAWLDIRTQPTCVPILN